MCLCPSSRPFSQKVSLNCAIYAYICFTKSESFKETHVSLVELHINILDVSFWFFFQTTKALYQFAILELCGPIHKNFAVQKSTI